MNYNMGSEIRSIKIEKRSAKAICFQSRGCKQVCAL